MSCSCIQQVYETDTWRAHKKRKSETFAKMGYTVERQRDPTTRQIDIYTSKLKILQIIMWNIGIA